MIDKPLEEAVLEIIGNGAMKRLGKRRGHSAARLGSGMDENKVCRGN